MPTTPTVQPAFTLPVDRRFRLIPAEGAGSDGRPEADVSAVAIASISASAPAAVALFRLFQLGYARAADLKGLSVGHRP